MKQIKTRKLDDTIGFMPYSESSISTLMNTTKHGTNAQIMSIYLVDKEGDQETLLETIYELTQHKAGNSAAEMKNREVDLAERELALQIQESKLKKWETRLKKETANA